MSSPLRHIEIARMKAAEWLPYFRFGLWSMHLVHTPGLSEQAPGPIGVDKYWRLYYDDNITDIPSDLMATVMIHELWHLISNHAARSEQLAKANGIVKRERLKHHHLKWNLAADMAINGTLRKEHRTSDGSRLPVDEENWVFPETFDLPENLTAEQYYAQIPDQQVEQIMQNMGGGDCEGDEDGEGEEQAGDICAGDCGSAADGNTREYEKETPADSSEGVTEARAQVVKRQIAKDIKNEHQNRGSLPGHLQKFVDDIFDPKVDWQRQLQVEIRRSAELVRGHDDFNFSRPGRRSAESDVVLPSMVSPVPDVHIVLDTSGSMWMSGQQDPIKQALGEINSILSDTNAQSVKLYMGDAEIAQELTIETIDQIDGISGGGGTDMGAIMESVVKNADKTPDILICITDGITPFPKNELDCHTIICLTSNESWQVPEWATVIKIEE